MKAQELIGKLAVRIKPAMASWGREKWDVWGDQVDH